MEIFTLLLHPLVKLHPLKIVFPANASPAINRAGANAARDNFDQAYAAAEGDRLHGNERDQRERDQAYLSVKKTAI